MLTHHLYTLSKPVSPVDLTVMGCKDITNVITNVFVKRYFFAVYIILGEKR